MNNIFFFFQTIVFQTNAKVRTNVMSMARIFISLPKNLIQVINLSLIVCKYFRINYIRILRAFKTKIRNLYCH